MIPSTVTLKTMGGTLKLDNLDENDQVTLDAFSPKLGFSLKDMDNFNCEEVVEYSMKLKKIKESLTPNRSNMKRDSALRSPHRAGTQLPESDRFLKSSYPFTLDMLSFSGCW
jgi:hypothetical protein